MAGPDQQTDKPVGAFKIIDNDTGIAQILIIIVVKDHGDAPAGKLLIAIQIGIENAGLYAVDNKPLEVLIHDRLQAPALI